jgi:nucleoside-diphosphate-sugar epimerase
VRVLVTGVAGFIGSHLGERLLADGYTLRGVDAFTPYYEPAIKRANVEALAVQEEADIVGADLRTTALEPLLDGVDAVFHFAAQPGVRTSWATFDEYVDHNVAVTHRLLEAVQHLHLERFVFASSSSVYGQVAGAVDEDAPTRPFSPYGVTKLAAESLATAYAQNFGLPVVSLRLFTVYGPRQRPDMAIERMIRSALTGEPFTVYGDGSQLRAFTYVDDVVDGAIAALGADVKPGSVFNISGGTTCSLNDVIATVGDAAGKPVPIQYRDPNPGDVERTDAVVQRAFQQLGWEPKTTLAEGIERQVAEVGRRLSARP